MLLVLVEANITDLGLSLHVQGPIALRSAQAPPDWISTARTCFPAGRARWSIYRKLKFAAFLVLQ